MIDETQDFDMIMLKMLLNDTTIPKIFVGDPKQSIYKFRGCINAFNYLPVDTLIIEFYSTFRIGNPACETIRNEFDDCWMISKSKNKTTFVNSFDIHEKYVYLFRSWRVLLQTAEKTNNIWIYNYEKKFSEITNLHKKLSYSKLNHEERYKKSSFQQPLLAPPCFFNSRPSTSQLPPSLHSLGAHNSISNDDLWSPPSMGSPRTEEWRGSGGGQNTSVSKVGTTCSSPSFLKEA